MLLGESRVYITDSLRRELGWLRGHPVRSQLRGPGLYVVAWAASSLPSSLLRQRGGEWYFDIKIPGVRRGRLNGSRTCKHSVENGTLVLDVRELLASEDP